MKKLISTQIYFPQSTIQKIKRIARRDKSSLSEVVREAVNRYLEFDAAKTKNTDPISKTARLNKSILNDISNNHDSYLYERKKS